MGNYITPHPIDLKQAATLKWVSGKQAATLTWGPTNKRGVPIVRDEVVERWRGEIWALEQ